MIEKVSLTRKNWFAAAVVGTLSSVAVAAVSFSSQIFYKSNSPDALTYLKLTDLAIAGVAGVVSFGTSFGMGVLRERQIRRVTANLQAQFDAVFSGNLNVQATVFSQDEIGQLAVSFNQITSIIFPPIIEAQQKVKEAEQALEELLRQVISMLDDIEEMVRNDVTFMCNGDIDVSVIGAITDAFFLTIQNLRDIVRQVKVAAIEINKRASNNEKFIHKISADVLRKDEELPITISEIQELTKSICIWRDRVKQIEEVTRNASAIALQGREAVECTVTGILDSHKTLTETTSKVKRLAECYQEITTIVASISTIASATNLLTLNPNIEAQNLANFTANACKEMEQIILPIESETISTIVEIEKANQQVIELTKEADLSNLYLKDIITNSNCINTLIRSITADTMQQIEIYHNVTQMLQSVQLNAQETAQETQRVSASLNHLVGVARDLLTLVERFRVSSER